MKSQELCQKVLQLRENLNPPQPDDDEYDDVAGEKDDHLLFNKQQLSRSCIVDGAVDKFTRGVKIRKVVLKLFSLRI